jgi:hypothetical protein
LVAGATTGNQRLTATTGAVLIVLLVLAVVVIPEFGPSLHAQDLHHN